MVRPLSEQASFRPGGAAILAVSRCGREKLARIRRRGRRSGDRRNWHRSCVVPSKDAFPFDHHFAAQGCDAKYHPGARSELPRQPEGLRRLHRRFERGAAGVLPGRPPAHRTDHRRLLRHHRGPPGRARGDHRRRRADRPAEADPAPLAGGAVPGTARRGLLRAPGAHRPDARAHRPAPGLHVHRHEPHPRAVRRP